MNTAFLIAAAAGLASALLFLSIGTGVGLAILFLYISPLPLLLVGLRFGWKGGLVGLVTGGGAALLLGPTASFGFVIGVAGPALLLAWRAEQDEAFPLGPIALLAAGVAAALTVFVLTLIDYGTPAFEAQIEGFVTSALTPGPEAGIEPARLAEMQANVTAGMVALLPAVAAMLWTFVLTGNAWLVHWIGRKSGWLAGAGAAFRTMSVPPAAALVFGLALGLSVIGGGLGAAGQASAAALGTVFLMLGLAVLHTLTARMTARRAVLTGVYVALFLMPWFGIGLIGLGLAETLIGLRARRSGDD